MKIAPTFQPAARLPAFALVLVLIVILSLTVLVAGFAMSMNVEMRLARNTDYDGQMEWMGRSGVELAKYALTRKKGRDRNIDALNQFWANGIGSDSNDVQDISLTDVPLGPGLFTVKITDMERKWDINLVTGTVPNSGGAQREILQRALQLCGVPDQNTSDTIIDSILDWVGSGAGVGMGGANNDYYMTLSPPYYCKSGMIDDMSELLLVKGMTPEIFWGSSSSNHPPAAFQQHQGGFDQPQLSHASFGFDNDHPDHPGLVDFFSPMGGKLNINTASTLTLSLIPGIDEMTAARIIQQRAGPDGQDGTMDDTPFQRATDLNNQNVQGGFNIGMQAAQLDRYCATISSVFEVHVIADINGYKRTFVAVLAREGNSANKISCVRFYWE